MKNALLFSVAFAMVMNVMPASAQEKAEAPKYQRSSLHMVLLNTNEPGLNGQKDFSADISNSWGAYPFPDKYNKHDIALTEAYGGAPKGSFLELVNLYSKTDFSKLGLSQLKDILSQLQAGKKYNEQLVAATDSIIKENKVAHQLVKKWFNIQDDGSFNADLISERAAYNADQAAVAAANLTARGVQGIIDQGESLIGNTFVTFSKLCFYESEPVAALIRDLTKTIAKLVPDPTGAVAPAAIAAADIAYLATKEGFTAKTTTALYQLVWDEETAAKFYSTFDGDKINLEKFNALDLKMKCIGIDNATTLTIDAGAGFASAVGAKPKNDDAKLIQTTIIRNVDKILAKMQKNYEEFAPVSQILSVDPEIIADMGMKEGLEGGESFNLLEQQFDKKTGKFAWKSVGVLKVDKKKIWDNRYSLTDDSAAAAKTEGVKGTVLSANKKAAPGMLVKMVVKAKKK